MAGHFALLGHEIRLYNRSIKKIETIAATKEISMSDKIIGTAHIHIVTDDFKTALSGAELIMIATTADAHRELACKMAEFLENNQVIVLNPGRTLGALEFSKELKKHTNKRFFIAEAQSLIYACRADTPGNVRIIGIKDKILLAAFPSTDTEHVLSVLNSVFSCFIKAKNILQTSLENIGAILHPSVILFNAAAIERGNLFYFYNDMTPAVANFLLNIDNERLQIGKAFGIPILSVTEWISYAYNGIEGETLLEKMRNNPAYYKILAPNTLYNRLLLEDVPTGILPLIELGRLAEVDSPLLISVLNMTQALLGMNFLKTGRTFKNLGMEDVNFENFMCSL